jgi:hypothetical protein
MYGSRGCENEIRSRAGSDFRDPIEAIMASPYFALGAADLRAGRGYRDAYSTWHTNDCWDYERGRAWAVSAPRSVKLRHNGKLNPAAIMWFHEDIL